jgi:hypothetical protein
MFNAVLLNILRKTITEWKGILELCLFVWIKIYNKIIICVCVYVVVYV